MTNKDRQRQRNAQVPRAGAPNWLLVVVAGAVTVGAMFATGAFA